MRAFGQPRTSSTVCHYDVIVWGKSPVTPTNVPPTPTRIINITGNLAFGDVTVGQTATASFTITNSGNSILTITGMTITGGLGPAFSGNWTSGQIPPGGSQQVVHEFRPTAVQTYNGVVTVNADQTSGSNTIPTFGNGVAPRVPSIAAGLHVWGGSNQSQYLGFFACTFCEEFAPDSINNEFGRYGSTFSSTSIRNEFSQYGSPFNSLSACNEFASAPPRVYNANRTVYYGELTINEFRRDAIGSLLPWLRYDVCQH